MDTAIYDVTLPLLYGELSDEVETLLSTDLSEIEKTKSSHFKYVIYKHLEKVKSKYLPNEHFFKENMDWFNTRRSLYLDTDLKNKILILDFFTYCCINCIHILPYLEIVETDYSTSDGVAVIGIHSPKFPHEKNILGINDALLRNNITHPVVNDADAILWKKFGIFCWPTVIILGPDHELLFSLVGESEIQKLPFICHHVIHYYAMHKRVLSSSPLPFKVKKQSSTSDFLYPGGISTAGNSILLSDSGNNRLVLITLEGNIQEIIGTGETGCCDGPFHKATFNNPHGTAWKGLCIYVADTGNHAIRKIDLQKKQVTTICKGNTNESAFSPLIECSSEDFPIKTKFQSPWDVCIAPQIGRKEDIGDSTFLYIAVAGAHQIWSLDLNKGNMYAKCTPCAGSGKEENRNNSYPLRAGFAQPSAIDYSPLIPSYLFVADSESSTIRSINLVSGAVKTIVGGGFDPLDLFKFGDADGIDKNVKLQHPMGLCVVDHDTLIITDTYNNKIKAIKIKEKTCFTYELKDSEPFSEPSAICYNGDVLFVADTNNHSIRCISYPEAIASVLPISKKVKCAEVECIANSIRDIPKAKLNIVFGGEIHCYFQVKLDPKYDVPKEDNPSWDVAIKAFHIQKKE